MLSLPPPKGPHSGFLRAAVLLGGVGTGLQGWVFTGSLGESPCAHGLLSAGPSSEAASVPCQACGGWFPKWREKSGVCPEKERSGLSGLEDGGTWLLPPLNRFRINIAPKRGWLPSSQTLASCLKRSFWKLPCREVGQAGPLQLPTLRH